MAQRVQAPKVDSRTSNQIEDWTRQLLCSYLGEKYRWNENADGGEVGKALTHVFAFYCSAIIDHINAAADNNFGAFVKMLGSLSEPPLPAPPLPATVPLTFLLDTTATAGTNVPMSTRVQAEAAGGGDPLVFETASDLWLTTFDLVALGTETTPLGHLILPNPQDEKQVEQEQRLFDRLEQFYLGLDLAKGRQFVENLGITLFFFIGELEYDPETPPQSDTGLRVIWEYSALSGDGWKSLYVEDDTNGLTRSGAVTFLAPADFVRAQPPSFSEQLYCVRASLRDPIGASALYRPAPRLTGVALNTVNAQQVVTVHDEVLASSNGNAGQTFMTFRKPVLPGERVRVIERRPPTVTTESDQPSEEWKAVADFSASSPQDRHYVVDRLAGRISFGNGINGMIPPPGVRNVILAEYRTSNGADGNDAVAGSVRTLLTGGRGIDRVTNLVPAAGGAAAETADSVLDRGPRALRHRNMSIAVEDFSDLAEQVPGVARALCIPLIDLASEPCKCITSVDDQRAGAGKTSVIIVPDSKATKPVPSLALLNQVQDDLRRRSDATAKVFVVGPLYLCVNITIQVRLEQLSLADQVKHDLEERFRTFLHPLRGGQESEGWSFGRVPHPSDIHHLIAGQVHGIRYVGDLQVQFSTDYTTLPGCDGELVDCIRQTRRFLIHSGYHTIVMS